MHETSLLVNRNPEEVAVNIMQKVLKGDNSALNYFLTKEVPPKLLDHVVSTLKANAVKALAQGKYNEAIDSITPVLVTTKDNKQKSVLYSKLSLAYLKKNDMEKALEAARTVITLNPDSSMGWYRAAQIFKKKKAFTSALTVIKAAQKRNDQDQHIQKLYQMLIPLAQKEKALERLSIDYSRFKEIDVPEQDKNVGEQTMEPVVEYSEHLTSEQRNQLDHILNPGSGMGSQSTPERSRLLLKFNPDTSRNIALTSSHRQLKAVKPSKTNAEHIRKGIIKLIQTRSELAWARSVALQQLLHCPHVLDVYLKHILDMSEGVVQNDPEEIVSWLFVGLGTSVPLVCGAYLDEKSHAIVACTHHNYPFSMWMAERMLDINGIKERKKFRLINKRVKELIIQKNRCDVLDAEFLDVCVTQHNVIVIDQECFDSTGVGKGIIHDLRHLRGKVCKAQLALDYVPLILAIPASMRVLVYGASIPPTHTTFREYEAKGIMSGYAEAAERCVAQGRWGTWWEPLPFADWSYVESEDNCRGVVILTTPVILDEFFFGGSLDSLEEDLPVTRSSVTKHFQCIKTGVLNCIIIRTEFGYCTSPIRLSHQNQITRVDGAASPAALWIETRDVTLGDRLQISYTLKNASEICVSIDHPAKKGTDKMWSVPRWQYDALCDTETLTKLHQVVEERITALLLEKCTCLETQTFVINSKTWGLEVLLLNSCLGVTALAVLQCIAKVFASRGNRPYPQVHVTVVEPYDAQRLTTKCLLGECKEQCDEVVLMKHQAVLNPHKEWVGFSGENKNTAAASFLVLEEEARARCALKLKQRVTVTAVNPCSLRPPGHLVDSKTQLAVKRLLNQPLDAPLPSSFPVYELHSKADIVVSQMIDSTLLGEGLLVLLSYARQALTKRNHTIIPATARLYTAAVSLGRPSWIVTTGESPTPQHIKPSCWFNHLLGDVRSVFGLSNEVDCFSVDLDRMEHRWITPPALAFEFKFQSTLQNDDILKHMMSGSQNIHTTALCDGVVNAVVFWFDVDFELETTERKLSEGCSVRGYSTRPKSIPDYPGAQARCRIAQQACLCLSDALQFYKDDPVPLCIWYSRSSVGASWIKSSLSDYFLRVRSTFSVMRKDDPRTPLWVESADNYAKNIDQLGGILADAHNNVGTLQEVADQLVLIILRPYCVAPDAYLDSQEALWFLLSLYT